MKRLALILFCWIQSSLCLAATYECTGEEYEGGGRIPVHATITIDYPPGTFAFHVQGSQSWHWRTSETMQYKKLYSRDTGNPEYFSYPRSSFDEWYGLFLNSLGHPIGLTHQGSYDCGERGPASCSFSSSIKLSQCN